MTGEDFMDHCTNVLIADSAEEFCTALSTSLQRAGGFVVCGTASDGEQAVAAAIELRPHLILMDMIAVAGNFAFIHFTYRLSRRSKRCKIRTAYLWYNHHSLPSPIFYR